MLNRLKISNFLLIEELELNFKGGLTVVTGETGSGKSIIIDALMIIFGAKFTLDIIRANQNQTTLEADFNLTNLDVINFLNENDLLDLDDTKNATFRRVIDREGKNKCYLNGHSITNPQARLLGELLLDIHTQHASITLLKTETQRNLLDEYAGVSDTVTQISKCYKKIKLVEQNLHEVKLREQELKIKRDLLAETVEELSSLNLRNTEWEELEFSHKQLTNIDEMLQELNLVEEILVNDDNSILNNLHLLNSRLTKLADMLPNISSITSILDSVNNELHELNHEINTVAKNIEKDPTKLAQIEERMEQIFALSRKYRIQPTEISEYLNKSQLELEQLGHNLNIKLLEEELYTLNSEYLKLAKLITSKRSSAAKDLSTQITQSLHKLAITGEFVVGLLPFDTPSSYGLENIEYQICFNKGLKLQPLNKTASGGELSRTALALYLLMSMHSAPELIIFDEIDVGIGGKIAAIVGQMLKQLGSSKQIICITHQPQSACYGDQHLVVSKTHTNNIVTTNVFNVTGNKRITEIARMLGGIDITETTLEHAKEMLSMHK